MTPSRSVDLAHTPVATDEEKSRSPFLGLREWSFNHPVLAAFLLAFVVRLLVVFGLALLSGGILARDDQTYWQMAIDKAAGTTSHWNDYTSRLFTETSTFLLPLTALAWLFGPIRLVGQIFVALTGAGVAALTTRVALEWLRRGPALLAGCLVALVPSQVIFSAALLKDPAVWLCLAGLAAFAAFAGWSRGWRLGVHGLVITLILVLLAYLRVHVLIVAGWSLVIASFFSMRDWRSTRILVSLVLALTVPLLISAGPGGATFVSSAGDLEERRLKNAERADSAFVEPVPQEPSEPAGVASEVPSGERQSSIQDQDEDEPTSGLLGDAIPGDKGDLKRLPAGLSAMLLQPYLWETGGSTQLRLARLEGIIWYPILLLALIGIVVVRRHLRVMAFPIVCGGGLLLVYALVEGNVGTAYRHRGDFVWVICLLAAAGANWIYLKYISSRSQRRQPTETR